MGGKLPDAVAQDTSASTMWCRGPSFDSIRRRLSASEPETMLVHQSLVGRLIPEKKSCIRVVIRVITPSETGQAAFGHRPRWLGEVDVEGKRA